MLGRGKKPQRGSVSVKHPAVASEASHLVQNPLPPLKDSGRRVLPPSYLRPRFQVLGQGLVFRMEAVRHRKEDVALLWPWRYCKAEAGKSEEAPPQSHKSQFMKHL